MTTIPRGIPCYMCGIPLNDMSDKPIAFFCESHGENHAFHFACLPEYLLEIFEDYQKHALSRWN